MRPALRLPFTAAFAFLVGTPALADHPVAGGGVSQSGPIITAGAETLPAGALAGGVGISFAKPDTYRDSELISLAGQHVHAHTTGYNLSVAAGLSYGVTGHFTLTASLPLIRRDDLRAGEHSHTGGAVSNTVERLGSISGIGDLSIMGRYQFAHDHDDGWGVALLTGLKLPTGSTSQTDLSGARLETEHQPGTGSWDPMLGLAASKSWDALSVHGSALYQFSTEGAQQTRLGDRANLNAALVYSLSAGNHSHQQSGDRGHGSWALMLEANGEWEGKQKIAGLVEPDSGSQVLYISPGVRFTAPSGWSAAVSAGVPIWQDVGLSHPENSFRLIAQVGASF